MKIHSQNQRACQSYLARIVLFFITSFLLGLTASAAQSPGQSKLNVPNSKPGQSIHRNLQKVYLAAGCFWGVEEIFRKVPGVTETGVGYTGGKKVNPTYSEVTTGRTGHAEAVEVIFDPEVVTFQKILDLFYKMHDPTTLDQQGNDRGSQYRSAVFVTSSEQKKQAQEFQQKVERSGAWHQKIVTEIKDAGTFYEAEEEHQKYLWRHPKGYDNHFIRQISFDSKESKVSKDPKIQNESKR